MLFALLAGCGGTNTVILALPLPGAASGMALAPDGGLAVTHTGATGLPRVSLFNPSTGGQVFGHPAGPGVPVVGDGRLYVLQEEGVVAFRGTAVDWTVDVGALVPNDGGIGLTNDGVVMFPTQSSGVGALHAVTHLGFELWTTPFARIPRGAPVTDGLNRVYVAAGDEVPELVVALDGDDGTVLWELPVAATPVLGLEDGVLVADGASLSRYDGDGEPVWSIPSTATTATRARDRVWTSGDALQRIDLATGTVLDSFGTRCGPVAVDLIGAAWALCQSPQAESPELTVVDVTPTSRSAPVGSGSVSIDAPLLANGVSYTLVGGENPRVLGFVAGVRESEDGWSRASGGPTNDRRNTP